MKLRPGIQILVVLALALFALFIGIGSALVEIATTTRVEVGAAVARADLAGRLVKSQLGITLARARGADLVREIRQDARLATVIQDAEALTPSVFYIMVADTLNRVMLHSEPRYEGRTIPARPELRVQQGMAANLRQFVALLRETGNAWEFSIPLMLDGRDFCSVRVGIAASLLREELLTVSRSHLLKILIQVLLATGLGLVVSWLVILRPLARLEKGIHHLQEGDFDYRVPVNTRDELGQLATQLNVLSETLALERERFASQRDSLVSEGNALRSIVEAVDDGLVMIDGGRRVLMANRTATRLLGLGFPDVEGRTLEAALPPDHPLVHLVDSTFAQGRRIESAQMELQTDAGRRTFLATCQVIGDSPNRQGGIVSLRDPGQVREIQKMLDHASVLSRLGKMAAGVAHEIRNPLNAINIHLELLMDKLSAPPGADGGQENLQTVRREIARLERVVDGFLKLARLQELTLAPIDVAAMLEDLRTLVLPEARLAGVDLDLEMAPDLPEIYGDETLLRQAVMNILRNAIQASPAGSPPIRVSARPQGDDRVCVAVQDCGPGMAPDLQAKIFDLYFTTRKDGTGVGLALVQQAIEMHGGTIDVRSAPGSGSTFTLCLPALASA